jgi:hypothetical protein
VSIGCLSPGVVCRDMLDCKRDGPGQSDVVQWGCVSEFGRTEKEGQHSNG